MGRAKSLPVPAKVEITKEAPYPFIGMAFTHPVFSFFGRDDIGKVLTFRIFKKYS